MDFDWKTISDGVIDLGLPILGGALGGPGGAAIGKVLASIIGKKDAAPADILKHLSDSSEAISKARQFELAHQETLLKMQLEADTAVIQAVNETMRAETVAERWPQYTWRPYNGFIVGTMAFGIYFILPLFKIPVPVIPETVWVMFGAILGVASWWRGVTQAGGGKDK